MPKKAQPEKARTSTLTIRVDHELNRMFSAILALNEETATNFFTQCVEKYVAENYEKAMEKLDFKKRQAQGK